MLLRAWTLTTLVRPNIVIGTCSSPLNLSRVIDDAWAEAAMRSLQAIFLFGAFALIYCARAYPPLGANLLLVAVFATSLTVGGVLFSAGKDQHVTAKYVFASVLPWLLAGLFLANVVLDRSKDIRNQTLVVESQYEIWTYQNVVVQAWRRGRTTESFYLNGYKNFLLPGQHLTIGVKTGALGIPWISSIYRHNRGEVGGEDIKYP